jgi:hypothetical protein
MPVSGKVGYVVTTINPPTKAMQTLSQLLSDDLIQPGIVADLDAGLRFRNSQVYVIADSKTPDPWSLDNCRYLSLSEQVNGIASLGRILPTNSYARKMYGYLEAFREGCEWIRETDDDNIPLEIFLEAPSKTCSVRLVLARESNWINIYSYFTKRRIWPRGLPLQVINQIFIEPALVGEALIEVENVAIYQALADGEPDVDALYRLTVEEESNIKFDPANPLLIPKGVFTPFNSQATTWHTSIFPLMYLPITCSFRMTDIWRSFVVQRLLQATNFNFVVQGPQVFQERNPHNLMKDFEDEIEGYLKNEDIRILLQNTRVKGGAENFLEDLHTLYESLVEANYLHITELDFLTAWIRDVTETGWSS